MSKMVPCVVKLRVLGFAELHSYLPFLLSWRSTSVKVGVVVVSRRAYLNHPKWPIIVSNHSFLESLRWWHPVCQLRNIFNPHQYVGVNDISVKIIPFLVLYKNKHCIYFIHEYLKDNLNCACMSISLFNLSLRQPLTIPIPFTSHLQPHWYSAVWEGVNCKIY